MASTLSANGFSTRGGSVVSAAKGKIMRTRVLSPRTALCSLLLIGLGPLVFGQEHARGVTAITEVFGDGQKVSAIAIEYDAAVANAALVPKAFSVDDRTITAVYANTAAAKAAPVHAGMGSKPAQGIDGKFVILELSPTDPKASTIEFIGQGPSVTSRKVPVRVSVKQAGDVAIVGGKTYAPWTKKLDSVAVSNVMPEGFRQLAFADPKYPDETLMYNLFVPGNYDKDRKYPLVLFMPDASATSDDPDMTLIQGLGALVWATPAEQAKHECIVLAPQYTSKNRQDAKTGLTYDLLTTVIGQYGIDKNRLYTTGQSAGCITSIALDIQYPDLFAASYLVAGQYDAQQVAPLAKQNLWIMVSAGDIQALPGMNAVTATLERNGAKVSRAVWDGKSTADELAFQVAAMRASDSTVKYTMLQRGTVVAAGASDDPPHNHMGTWAIAYSIEGIRDWLFAQVNARGYSAKELSDQGEALARTGDSFGAALYFLRAAALGSMTADERLGEAYASGRGVPTDCAKAAEYDLAAIALGSSRAYTNLGILYQDGTGVSRDYAKALELFENAARTGDFKGPRWAGIIYLKGLGGTKADRAKAARYFLLAAERGDITANYYLGYLYENGLEFARDYKKAAEYYKQAAPSDGHIEVAACLALGRLYENGLGVDKDLIQAAQWYKQGAALGDADARKALERLTGL
jgi:predicted peptidase/TPR repeat protein